MQKKELKNKKNNNDSNVLIDYSERQDDTIAFLNISQSAIKKHGLDKVIALLNNLDVQTEIQSLYKTELIDFILDCVVLEFKEDHITKKDLFFRHKRGDVTLARKMAIILIKQFISELSDKHIGNFFGRKRQLIFITMEEFKQMNPKNTQHAIFLTKHGNISRKVELFVERNKKA